MGSATPGHTFPWGAEREGGGSRRKERWKGGKMEGKKEGRRRKENREPWLGTLRSRHRAVAGIGEAGGEKEGLLPVLLP